MLADDASEQQRVPSALLWTAVGCTLASVTISLWSILRHLYSYQRPGLQRLVIRIMLMIPIYAVASLASLWSLQAAFFIDAVRDVYEAFVIYTFFTLLLLYLGGPRSLLTLLHSSLRPPTPHPFPLSLVLHPLDLSDPHSYLALKRGVLQYCVVKPILALVTVGLKLGEVYDEGQIGVGTGYTWVSVVYNASISVSLYCLAMFWVTIHADVRPFRPTPKFLCVKGILFFSFWQSIAISLLVKWGAIKSVGTYTDHEHISLALNNILISCEMPAFAVAHTYAFCVLSDYVDPALSYTARLPLSLAFRDAFGYLDLYYDFLLTLKGQGMSYRSFEPSGAEWGVVREGRGRERRLRDGLRYEGGGKGGKYWLPGGAKTDADEILRQAAVGHPTGGGGSGGAGAASAVGGGGGGAYGAVGVTSPIGFGVMRHGHGPHSQAYRSPPVLAGSGGGPTSYFPVPAESDDDDDGGSSVSSLEFSDPPSPSSTPSSGSGGGGLRRPAAGSPAGVGPRDDEALYAEARGYLHGDWAYTVIDVSKEAAKRAMREEEENVLRGHGRRGEGRRAGERWGRGGLAPRRAEGSKSPKVGKGKKAKGRSYGAYHDNDDRHNLADEEAGRSSASPPAATAGGSVSGSGPSTAVHSPGSEPDEHESDESGNAVRKQWTTTSRQVARGLKAVASKVVPPPPHLRFDTDELRRSGALSPGAASGARGGTRSRSGSRPTSPGTGQGELPPDAVDLVVEDEDAWLRELERRRRRGEPGRHGDDVVDGIYRRAEWIDGERSKGRIVREEVNADGVRVESHAPPVVRVSSPSASPPTSRTTTTTTTDTRTKTFDAPVAAAGRRSPWFDANDNEAEDQAGVSSSSSSGGVSPAAVGEDEANPWH